MNFKKTAAIVAAAGALTALAIPAMAEFTPYASIRLTTGYQTVKYPSPTASDTDTSFKLPGTTRLGMKASEGALGAVIELGINEGGAAGSIYNRLAYATYKMNGATLLVGQDYTKSWNPSALVGPSDTPSNLGWGNMYDGRIPQIRVQLDNGFYFAAIQPATPADVAKSSTPVVSGTPPAVTIKDVAAIAYDTLLPKLNVGYDGKAGDVGYGAGLVYGTYSYKSGTVKEDINSYLVYARANMTSGPIALKANLGYGQNLGNMNYTGAGFVPVGTKVEDSTTLEGYVQAGYTVSPTLKVQAIIGGQTNKNDTYTKSDSRMSYAVNAPVTVTKNFTITPEVLLFDEMKKSDGTNDKKTYYYGAKWQLDF